MKKLSILTCLALYVLLISSCKNVLNKKVKKSRTISLEINNESNLNIKNPNALITLYGYDEFMADVGATIISQKTIKIAQRPFYLDLKLPNNPESIITPKISSKENVKYYLSFYCDNNNNKIDDEGDIKIDFNKAFSEVNIDSHETQIFYIKEY